MYIYFNIFYVLLTELIIVKFFEKLLIKDTRHSFFAPFSIFHHS